MSLLTCCSALPEYLVREGVCSLLVSLACCDEISAQVSSISYINARIRVDWKLSDSLKI